jgi:hypothetical protein
VDGNMRFDSIKVVASAQVCVCVCVCVCEREREREREREIVCVCERGTLTQGAGEWTGNSRGRLGCHGVLLMCC